MSNSLIWPIDRILSGATTLGQNEAGSKSNERVLCIPQSSSIIETSPSDCLVSYPGHSLGGLQSVSISKSPIYQLNSGLNIIHIQKDQVQINFLKKKLYKKNVNMNIQWTWFSNLLVWNNPRWVNMLSK